MLVFPTNTRGRSGRVGFRTGPLGLYMIPHRSSDVIAVGLTRCKTPCSNTLGKYRRPIETRPKLHFSHGRNLENAASHRTTAYHCTADVSTSLAVTARTVHNCRKLEVERAALYTVALRCKWVEGRSRSGVRRKVRPVVPVTTSSPRLSFRARSSHCQMLAFPLTHSPEGGCQWCQITPGVPTPRLLGVCGFSCEWNMQHSARARRCGWRWKVATGVDVRELRSEHLHEEGTRSHHAYHAKPSSTMSDVPQTPLDKPVHKRHVQRWLVAVAMRADAEMQRHLEINGLRDDNRMRLDRCCASRSADTGSCTDSHVLANLCENFFSLSRVSHPVQKRTANLSVDTTSTNSCH